jgi:hypothetical protein
MPETAVESLFWAPRGTVTGTALDFSAAAVNGANVASTSGKRVFI